MSSATCTGIGEAIRLDGARRLGAKGSVGRKCSGWRSLGRSGCVSGGSGSRRRQMPDRSSAGRVLDCDTLPYCVIIFKGFGNSVHCLMSCHTTASHSPCHETQWGFVVSKYFSFEGLHVPRAMIQKCSADRSRCCRPWLSAKLMLSMLAPPDVAGNTPRETCWRTSG